MNEISRLPDVIANQPCCVCGGVDSEPFFDRRYDKFNYSGEFHMRRCSGCGLLFCSPRLSDEGIAQLYDSNYYVFQKPDRDYFQRTAAIYQRTVAMLPSAVKGKILEIGSGKGYLLAVLKGLGWEPYGIEISDSAVDYAQNTFGIAGFSGTVDQYLSSGTNAVFPVVVCIDIIEHVTEPDKFIDALCRVTESGGYLIIDTPNATAGRIDTDGAGWRGFNPFHIFVFSKDNLTKILENRGFVVEKAFTYNNGTTVTKQIAEKEASFLSRLSKQLFQKKISSEVEVNDLETCVSACRSISDFFTTPDSSGEFAENLKGENLILIARRR